MAGLTRRFPGVGWAAGAGAPTGTQVPWLSGAGFRFGTSPGEPAGGPQQDGAESWYKRLLNIREDVRRGIKSLIDLLVGKASCVRLLLHLHKHK